MTTELTKPLLNLDTQIKALRELALKYKESMPEAYTFLISSIVLLEAINQKEATDEGVYVAAMAMKLGQIAYDLISRGSAIQRVEDELNQTMKDMLGPNAPKLLIH